jgi:hypothetical protein
MSVLEFISNLIDNLLSWPVILAGVLLFFRRPVAALLRSVSEWEGFGKHVKFGEQVAAAEEKVEDAAGAVEATTAEGGAVAPQEKTGPREADELALIADSNPSYAVLAAWEALEGSILNLGETAFSEEYLGNRLSASEIKQAQRAVRTGNVRGVLRGLLQANVVSTDLGAAMNELRDLRNAVAHGAHNPTPGEALTIVESARKCREAVETIMAGVLQRTEELRRLGELHRTGVLSDEEFAAAKAHLPALG